MLDLGSLHFCLGMEILYNKELGILSIGQQRHIEENVFQRYNMQSYNLTIMPMEVELNLNKEDSLQIEEEKTKMVNILYQNVVGSLRYAMVSTRLDIAHVVNLIVQYLLNHGENIGLQPK